MYTRETMDKLFKPLVDNWVVLAALVGLGVGWGTTVHRVGAAETAQTQQEQRIQKIEENISKIKEDQAAQRAAADAQKESVQRIDRSLEEILRELRNNPR